MCKDGEWKVSNDEVAHEQVLLKTNFDSNVGDFWNNFKIGVCVGRTQSPNDLTSTLHLLCVAPGHPCSLSKITVSACSRSKITVSACLRSKITVSACLRSKITVNGCLRSKITVSTCLRSKITARKVSQK